MKKIIGNSLLTKLVAGGVAITILLLIAGVFSSTLQAQPVISATNTALGGGGTAYLSGHEAIYWNPANMAINDHQGTLHIGIGHSGIRYEPVLSSEAIGEQFSNFTDSYFPYKNSAVTITSMQRQTILDKNYPRNRLRSQHQSRADIILGGVAWYRGDETFSLSARARFSSRINVGRGWYSDDFIERNNQEIRDFTLDQEINQNIEIAFGYAREFTFLEGLFARVSKLYTGITSKFIIAGPHFNANYNGQQVRSEDHAEELRSDFTYHSSGHYSQMTRSYISSGNPQSAIDNHLDKQIGFSPTGYGVAFDIGLTYLIPIGSDLNLIEDDPQKSIVGKSLRIAVSMNDIGMVFYNEQPVEFSTPSDTTQIGRESVKQSKFIGAGGQYLTYFNDSANLPNPFESNVNLNQDPYSTLTPTSFNAGVLLDLKRIKFMGDLTLGFNNTAFTNSKLAMHLGMELRPLEKVPIRSGIRIASELPPNLSLGTGFETRYWDFNIGTQIIFRSHTFTTELAAGAVAGLQLHF